jgi:hypothetical protein
MVLGSMVLSDATKGITIKQPDECCSSSTTPLSQRVQMRLLYRLSWLVCSLG